MFCTKCGKEILDTAVVCVGCGCPVKSQKAHEEKWSSGTMAALVIGSVLIPLIGIIFGVLSLNKPERKRQGKILLVISLSMALIAVVALFSFAHWYKSNNAFENSASTLSRVIEGQPMFMEIGTFTTNLTPDEAGDRFIQLAITLKLSDSTIEQRIHAFEPEIKSKINALLASKKESEISTEEGKHRLAEEIRAMIEGILGIGKNIPHESVSASSNVTPSTTSNSGLDEVMFTSYIIQ